MQNHRSTFITPNRIKLSPQASKYTKTKPGKQRYLYKQWDLQLTMSNLPEALHRTNRTQPEGSVSRTSQTYQIQRTQISIRPTYLDHRHEYDPINNTMALIKTCRKGSYMNILEQYYIQSYQKQDALIEEQHPMEENILFKFITPPTPSITQV